MITAPYKMSFIGASLAVSESLKIAAAYLQLKDWQAVKEKVQEENILQSRTRSSMVRIYRELATRLEGLTQEQLELLVESSSQEQKQLLWYAVCKRYAYIQEFAIEVLHEKFMHLDDALTDFDYAAFFSRKADWHAELDHLTDSTRRKAKTIIFRMLREADLISEAHTILPAVLSERVAQAIAADGVPSFQFFPTPESNFRP